MRFKLQVTLLVVFCLAATHGSDDDLLTAVFNNTLGPDRDRDGLLALRAAVLDEGYGRSKIKFWGTTKVSEYPCSEPEAWEHVTCKDGRVVKLALGNLNVRATLPVELREMDALTHLLLQGNTFIGSLPSSWGEPPYFPALQSLNLAHNRLNGTLPDAPWSEPGAWPSLTALKLEGNKLHGGLPDGWVSGEGAFASLHRLDLSDNWLGYSDEGTTSQPNDCFWCTPLSPALPKLLHLDLSENGLTGKLPENWPLSFPLLRTLDISGNKFSVQGWESRIPSPLPRTWTVWEGPNGTAFPHLSDLLLYPGNDYICSLPDGMGGGFQGVNLDGTFTVSSNNGEVYDDSTPWLCPTPPGDNPPTIRSLGVSPTSGEVTLVWSPPPQPQYVYGYKMLLRRWSPDAEQWELVPGWGIYAWRTFTYATRPSLPKGLKLTQGGDYAAELEGYRQGGLHKVELYSFNVDITQSSTAEVEAELTFPAADQ